VVYQARAGLLCDQPCLLIRVGQSSESANSTTTSSTSLKLSMVEMGRSGDLPPVQGQIAGRAAIASASPSGSS